MNFQGVFLKFGRDCDIEQLQKKGVVYCNTVNYFKELEGDEMRADEFETATMIGTRKDLILEIWPVDNPASITRIATTKIAQHIVSPFGNLYCMYALNTAKMSIGERVFIDPRLKKTSESVLIIRDVNKFLDRLHDALDKEKICWEHHLVEYVDFSNYYGNRTFFQKDKQFGYQNEFRVFIHNDKFQIVQVEIGDISDISIKIPSVQLETAFFVKQPRTIEY